MIVLKLECFCQNGLNWISNTAQAINPELFQILNGIYHPKWLVLQYLFIGHSNYKSNGSCFFHQAHIYEKEAQNAGIFTLGRLDIVGHLNIQQISLPIPIKPRHYLLKRIAWPNSLWLIIEEALPRHPELSILIKASRSNKIIGPGVATASARWPWCRLHTSIGGGTIKRILEAVMSFGSSGCSLSNILTTTASPRSPRHCLRLAQLNLFSSTPPIHFADTFQTMRRNAKARRIQGFLSFGVTVLAAAVV